MCIRIGTMLLLLTVQLLVTDCISQNTIEGKVLGEDEKILESATISLFKDSAFIAGALSDSLGGFSFEVAEQSDYELRVSYVGYTEIKRSVQLKENNLKLEDIVLSNSAILNEVVVRGNKPVIVREIDRLIFNVQSKIIASIENGWDALRNTPGVIIDNNNSISAVGKPATVYINDRELRMAPGDLSEWLKSMPVSNIDRIEVLTTPPAKYDAEGGAIIRIILKRNENIGFLNNVRSSFTAGKLNRYQSGLSISYGHVKWNAHFDYNFRDGKYRTDTDEYIIYDNGTSISNWDISSQKIKKGPSHSYRTGFDYYITNNHSISFQSDGYKTETNVSNISNTAVGDPTKQLDSLLTTDNKSLNSTDRYSFNLNYQGNLGANRGSISADIDYSLFKTNPSQIFSTDVFDNQSELQSHIGAENNSDQSIDVKSAKVDYSVMIDSTVFLELGGKSTNINIENDLMYRNLEGDIWGDGFNGDNEFAYEESNFALYTSLSGGVGKLALKAGVRGEWTELNSFSVTLGERSKQRYFKLFPTAYIQYPVNQSLIVNAAYSKRIQRPDFWRLNPLQFYTNPYSYIVGNPGLQPAFVNSLELSTIWKNRYIMTLFYNRTADQFTNITDQENETQRLRNIQVNLDGNSELGVQLIVPLNPAPFWEVNTFTKFSQRKEFSEYLEGDFNYDQWLFYFSVNNSFTLSKDRNWAAELSFWYFSPSIQGIYQLYSTNDLSIGVRKRIFKGKGYIAIRAADILYGNPYQIKVDYLDQKNGFIEQRDSRSFTVSLSYRFGNNKIKKTKQRNYGNEEELKRIRKQ